VLLSSNRIQSLMLFRIISNVHYYPLTYPQNKLIFQGIYCSRAIDMIILQILSNLYFLQFITVYGQ